MHNLIRILSVFLFLIAINSSLHAQKEQISTGSAEAKVGYNNMTLDQTYDYAKQEAMINAIENAFGIYVEEQTSMHSYKNKTTFNIIGSTRVNGDWIETIGAPEYTVSYKLENSKYGERSIKYIKCIIIGKVRESFAQAHLHYEILNSPDIKARNSNFYHKEQLYIYFKSPVSGYLSVFIEDDVAVYRLLPYVDMIDRYQSGVLVQGDKGYLFFSPSHNSFSEFNVDEMQLILHKNNIEYNNIYIVFSEEKFIKPILTNSDKQDELILPKSLSPSAFQQWLASNRATINSFQVIKEVISIRKNKL